MGDVKQRPLANQLDARGPVPLCCPAEASAKVSVNPDVHSGVELFLWHILECGTAALSVLRCVTACYISVRQNTECPLGCQRLFREIFKFRSTHAVARGYTEYPVMKISLQKQAKNEVLRARCDSQLKNSVIQIANIFGVDESDIVRIAIKQYAKNISEKNPLAFNR